MPPGAMVLLIKAPFSGPAPAGDFQVEWGFGEGAGEHAFGVEVAYYEPLAMRDDVVVAPGGAAEAGSLDCSTDFD